MPQITKDDAMGFIMGLQDMFDNSDEDTRAKIQATEQRIQELFDISEKDLMIYSLEN
jgi:hypothetical protein